MELSRGTTDPGSAEGMRRHGSRRFSTTTTSSTRPNFSPAPCIVPTRPKPRDVRRGPDSPSSSTRSGRERRGAPAGRHVRSGRRAGVPTPHRAGPDPRRARLRPSGRIRPSVTTRSACPTRPPHPSRPRPRAPVAAEDGVQPASPRRVRRVPTGRGPGSRSSARPRGCRSHRSRAGRLRRRRVVAEAWGSRHRLRNSGRSR